MSWREIKTQEDIDRYFEETGYMIDSVILSVHYLTGHERFKDVYGKERSTGSVLLMRVKTPFKGIVELLFTDVLYQCVNGASPEDHIIEFRSDLLGKTKDVRALLYETKNWGDHNDKIISSGMKWRFASEADEFDCMDEDYAPFT